MSKTFKSELSDLEDKYAKLVDALCAKIAELPENDKIQEIPNESGVRMFIMKAKDLGGVWSPHYHQFKSQYEMLIDIFKHTRVENILDSWTEIKKVGYIRQSVYLGRSNIYNIHTDVIKYVDEVLGN
jgi:hypothetical protein